MERITIEKMPEVKTEEQKYHLIRYINFINSRPDRKNIVCSFHIHHIYPRKMAIKNKIQDYDGDWNLIELTPREHFIAHMMLFYCGYKEMVKAFLFMCWYNKNKINSRQYEKVKKENRIKNIYCTNGESIFYFVDSKEVNIKFNIRIKSSCFFENGYRGYVGKYNNKIIMWGSGLEIDVSKEKVLENYNIFLQDRHGIMSNKSKGRKWNKYQRKVMSKIIRPKGKDHPNYGKTPSKETIYKANKTRKQLIENGINHPFSIKIKCVDLNLIFNSLTEAAKFAKVSITAISNCAKHITKTSAGFKWEFVE